MEPKTETNKSAIKSPERRSRSYSRSLVDPYSLLDVFINSEDLVMGDSFDSCALGPIYTGELTCIIISSFNAT
jgi:hypothetical protein